MGRGALSTRGTRVEVGLPQRAPGVVVLVGAIALRRGGERAQSGHVLPHRGGLYAEVCERLAVEVAERRVVAHVPGVGQTFDDVIKGGRASP